MNVNRTILALSLCALVLILQPYYMEWLGYNIEPVENTSIQNKQNENEVVSENKINQDSNNILSDSPAIANKKNNLLFNETERIVTIKTNLYEAKISSVGGGSYKEFILFGSNDLTNYKYLGGYNENGIYDDSMQVSLINPGSCSGCIALFDKNNPNNYFQPIWESFTITNLPDGQEEVSLGVEDSLKLDFYLYKKETNTTITKTMVFYGNKYTTAYKIDSQNLSQKNDLGISWVGGLRTTEKGQYEDGNSNSSFGMVPYEEGLISGEDTEIISIGEEPLIMNNNVKWTAIKNKYFISAFLMNQQNGTAQTTSGTMNIGPLKNLPIFNTTLTASTNHLSGLLYLGPLDINYIKQLPWNLDPAMNFGWAPVRPFSKLVLSVLKFLYQTLQINYGLILILFAFLIRFITGPLTKKSFLSQQKMQALQPKIKTMNEKYKDDPKRQQRALIELYREKGVNPVGGCLPMLLQMPLLFALFTVFRSTIEFRGASFMLWITDLSQPDYILDLPFNIPIYGNGIAIIPVLFGITMIYNMKNSMATMDPAQKPLMYVFNGFFVLLFNSFPSGLNLYYTTYNILSIMQQRSLKKTFSVS